MDGGVPGAPLPGTAKMAHETVLAALPFAPGRLSSRWGRARAHVASYGWG